MIFVLFRVIGQKTGRISRNSTEFLEKLKLGIDIFNKLSYYLDYMANPVRKMEVRTQNVYGTYGFGSDATEREVDFRSEEV